jgi:hypothetical protein
VCAPALQPSPCQQRGGLFWFFFVCVLILALFLSRLSLFGMAWSLLGLASSVAVASSLVMAQSVGGRPIV